MKTLVYDLEILNAIPPKNPKERVFGINYCKGWTDYSGMGISVLVVYCNWLDEPMQVFTAGKDGKIDEFQILKIFGLFCKADVIAGFNSFFFDDNFLEPYFDICHRRTDYDLLAEVRMAKGLPPHYVRGITPAGLKLEDLARANLRRSKLMSGELAPIAWQQGRHKQVIDYCIDDVLLTYELYTRWKSMIDPISGQVLKLRNPEEVIQKFGSKVKEDYL